ncbi:MAG: hypothetical protein HY303_09995 [Candidatus Wallbacteria bacterium]|nr:hypothetical protein [Candidatus Wallbacteria bacterium]
MTEPKKFSIEQIRAAKAKTVMKTAVRPAARAISAPRSYRRPILIGLLAVGGLALALAAHGWSAWTGALDEAGRQLATGLPHGFPAEPPLASDRDMQKLLGLFKPPSKVEWAEIEATAKLRRTGNVKARQLLEANQAYVEAFRAVFPADSVNMIEVYKNGAPLLNSCYDVEKLAVMLTTTAAMAHVMLEQQKTQAGMENLLGLVRAGEMLARGVAGRYQAQAWEAGRTVASTARLLLLANAYAGALPAAELDRLGERLRTTLALEPDLRRMFIAERDLHDSVAERFRDHLGFWWSAVGAAGYDDPFRALKSAYASATDALAQPPKAALPAMREATESLRRSSQLPFLASAAVPLASYEKGLRHYSIAVGAVAGAIVLSRLSRNKTLPENLQSLYSSLPRDPLTDQPFRYQNLGDGFRLWAVGPDLTDDGGDEVKDVLLLGTPKQ